MTEVSIRLEGIECEGRHGASPGERDAPQRFLVDVELVATTGGDTVDETVDYRAVAGTVRDVVSKGSFALIETMAASIAQAVRALDRVGFVTVTVHKPAAAERHGMRDVSVRLGSTGFHASATIQAMEVDGGS